LIIAILASIFWIIYDPSKTINVFTAVLIVACPCALALSTPFAVGTAMRVLGRNGCYLKNGETIEEMNKVDHVVFDKTGTITNQGIENIAFIGELNSREKDSVCALAANSYHPLSRRINSYLDLNPENNLANFNEYPGEGIEAYVDGQLVRLGSSEFVRKEPRSHDVMSSSQVFISLNNKVKGYFEIRNQYRDGLEEVISNMGIKKELSLLSGDNSSEKEFLTSVFPNKSELKFDQSAYEKLDFVKDLQKRKNGSVMMVGDGLNDAGALAQADIGVAVTEDVNNFTPASDVILAGKEFGKLPGILKFSTSTVHVIVASFIISFLYNVVGLSFAVTGNLTPVFAAILMPLSSISVVLFTTITVNWQATRWGFK
jgi:Cu+-exporting ATPase